MKKHILSAALFVAAVMVAQAQTSGGGISSQMLDQLKQS